MLLHEVLVLELGPVDRLATGAVSGGEVAALAHEAGDDSVESRALVVQGLPAPSGSLLSGAKSSEVLRRSRRRVGVEFHHDPSRGGPTDRDVEVHLRIRHCIGSMIEQGYLLETAYAVL